MRAQRPREVAASPGTAVGGPSPLEPSEARPRTRRARPASTARAPRRARVRTSPTGSPRAQSPGRPRRRQPRACEQGDRGAALHERRLGGVAAGARARARPRRTRSARTAPAAGRRARRTSRPSRRRVPAPRAGESARACTTSRARSTASAKNERHAHARVRTVRSSAANRSATSRGEPSRDSEVGSQARWSASSSSIRRRWSPRIPARIELGAELRASSREHRLDRGREAAPCRPPARRARRPRRVRL